MASDLTDEREVCWLIERPGPRWLGAGGRSFYWVTDAVAAIRFVAERNAHETMMALRDALPVEMFPRDESPRATEHVFVRFVRASRASSRPDAGMLAKEFEALQASLDAARKLIDDHAREAGITWIGREPAVGGVPPDATARPLEDKYRYTAAYASKGGETVHAVRDECSMTAECTASVTKMHGVQFDPASAFACRNCLRAIEKREDAPPVVAPTAPPSSPSPSSERK